MTTEDLAASGAAAEVPAPVVVEPEVTTREPAEPQEPQVEADPLKAAEERLERERKNFQRRIDRKHAQAVEAEERAKALEARLQQFEQKSEPAEPKQDLDTLVRQRAQEMRHQEQLGERVRKTLEAGQKLENFAKATNTVADELGFFDRSGKPTQHLEALLDAEAPHELIVYLDGNAEVLESLQGLSPTRFARELTRIENEMREAKKPKVSAAPKPITPVPGNSAGSDPDPSQMTDAQFAAWRKKQIAARRA